MKYENEGWDKQIFEYIASITGNSQTVGYIIRDVSDNTGILAATDSISEYLGYGKLDHIQPYFDTSSYIHPDDKEKTTKIIRECYEKGENYSVLYRCRSSGWGYIWMREEGHVVTLPDGKRVALCTLSIEQDDKDEGLEKLPDDLRIAMSINHKRVVRYDVDASTAYIVVSGEKADSRAEKVENIPEVYITEGMIAPETQSAYITMYSEIRKGIPGGTATICMRSDGGEFRWYDARYKTLFHDDGRPCRAYIVYTDITQTRQREIAYRRAKQEMMSKPLEDVMYYEFIINKNTCEMEFGKAVETVLDKVPATFDDVIDYASKHMIYADDVPMYLRFQNRQRLLEQFYRGVRQDRLMFRATGPNGSFRWTVMQVELMEDPYTSDVRAFYVFDIVDGKMTPEMRLEADKVVLERELEQYRIQLMRNQMQPHFLYNALGALRTMVKTNPKEVYKLILDFSTVLRASMRALTSDDLIPFSEEMDNVKSYLSLLQVRYSSVLRVDYDIRCKNFNIVPLTIQPLVENSVNHGIFPRGMNGGYIKVSSWETDDAYHVCVADDGGGFDVDAARANPESFGLHNLTFRLERLQNARLDIQSELGKGTRATVSIPKRSDITRPLRCIVVDDEWLMLKQFEIECGDMAGITVLGSFEDAESALAFARENELDAAFLDVRMPGMDGVQLGRELKRLYPEIVLVYMTAYDGVEGVPEKHLVTKPYTKQSVLEALNNARGYSMGDRDETR